MAAALSCIAASIRDFELACSSSFIVWAVRITICVASSVALFFYEGLQRSVIRHKAVHQLHIQDTGNFP